MSDTGTPDGRSDADRPSEGSLPARQIVPKAPRDRRGRAALIVAVLALLVSLLLVVGGVALWYQGTQPVRQVRATVQSLDQQLEGRLTELDQRLAQLEGLGETQTRQASRLDELEGTIGTLRGTLEQMRETLVGISNVVQAGRLGWTLTGSERLLEVANARLQLTRDVGGALTALRLAQGRLGALDDPRLFSVREAIQSEVSALEAVAVADVEGMALTLASMVESVPRLPLQRDVPTGFVPGDKGGDAAPGEAEAWWRRAWASIRSALRSLVDVRRTDQPTPALMAPRHEYFLYQNLQLKLQAARLSLLRGDTAGFHVSVATAREWLDTYFQPEAAGVAAMKQSLAEMADIDLTPTLPDIAGSLALLRERMQTLGKTDIQPPGTGSAGQ